MDRQSRVVETEEYGRETRGEVAQGGGYPIPLELELTPFRTRLWT